MDVQLPDGTLIKGVPDGTTKADLVAKLKGNGMAVPSEWLAAAPPAPPEKPLAVKVGETLGQIPRQLGLTARYGLEGLANTAQIFTEPVRMATDAVAGTNSPALGKLATRFADYVGLPSPETPNERVIGDAARLIAGSGGMVGGAKLAANALTGVAKNVAGTMAQGPAQQAIGAGAAGLSGGSVREAGGSDGAQFAASLAGGVAAPMAANKLAQLASRGTSAVRTAFTPQAVIDQNVDQQISLALKQQGIDWGGVSERIKQGMREDVAQAIGSGDKLDPAATARMLQFRMVPGTQPTRGMISQDPIQITKEKNLSKVGANSTDIGLQALPNLESANTNVLLRTLDTAGAAGAPNSFDTGARGVNALESLIAQRRSGISALYDRARGSDGRSLPLEGGIFTDRAGRLIDEANVGSFLPQDIKNKMNKIALGEIPLTVDVAEQLKTSIGNLQRGANDGNVRHALGLVRQALDDTPLQGSANVNPGNLPAVPGSVPPSVSAGQESIDAYNAARRAHREWRAQVDSTPALQAVENGIEPDQFVRRFITGNGATAADVQALADAASGSPQTIQAIKQHLVAHLKDAATGQANDINKFRADSFNNALNNIGDRKLAVFFSPEEIAQLRAVGRVANYASAQPAGTAVNNSNSGVYMAAKAMEALDAIAGKLPLGLDTTIQGVIRGVQQRQVMKSGNALRAIAEKGKQPNPLASLPVIVSGQRSDDR